MPGLMSLNPLPRIFHCFLLAFTLAGWGSAAPAAQDPAAPPAPPRLIVGVKEAPPFMMHQRSGRWSGISCELWQKVAERMGLQYEFREYDLDGLLKAVSTGQVQAAIAALSVTADREAVMDFSNTYYSTGLGIATTQVTHLGFGHMLGMLFAPAILKTVAALAGLFLIMGALIWLIERRHNPDHLHPNPLKGIFCGAWWSAVNMFGHDDMIPKSALGRLVAVAWMILSIILISFFTAMLASNFTIDRLQTKVSGADDLVSPTIRVGAVRTSTGELYLAEQKIAHQGFATVDEALAALLDGSVDAVVHDWPILKYCVNKKGLKTLKVLPRPFNEQNYAIALPPGSPLRKAINRNLLACIEEPEWDETLNLYLGEH